MKDGKNNPKISDSTLEKSESSNEIDHGDRGGKANVSQDQYEIMQDPEEVEENLDLSGKE